MPRHSPNTGNQSEPGAEQDSDKFDRLGDYVIQLAAWRAAVEAAESARRAQTLAEVQEQFGDLSVYSATELFMSGVLDQGRYYVVIDHLLRHLQNPDQ